MYFSHILFFFFFFNDTATTEIYTLSLHDALPISACARWPRHRIRRFKQANFLVGSGMDLPNLYPSSKEISCTEHALAGDRKSTRLNSSHSQISYAVFCLKKKTKRHTIRLITN